MHRVIQRSQRILCLAALGVLLSGCAISSEKYRRTLNLLDQAIAPKSTAARVALAPIALPLGLMATVADQFFVHPVTVVDDAWDDTIEALWSVESETAFRRGLLLPLKTIATPFLFLGDFLMRSALPINSD